MEKKYTFRVAILKGTKRVDGYTMTIFAFTQAEADEKAQLRLKLAAKTHAHEGDVITLESKRGRQIAAMHMEKVPDEDIVYLVVAHHPRAVLSSSKLFIRPEAANNYYQASCSDGVYVTVILLQRRPGQPWEAVKSFTP